MNIPERTLKHCMLTIEQKQTLVLVDLEEIGILQQNGSRLTNTHLSCLSNGLSASDTVETSQSPACHGWA
jgi:hypothetical protein